MIFVGNDWAEDHHDVCVMDDTGHNVTFQRFDEGIEGVARFHALMAEHVTDPGDVVIGIETDRGLWVEALVGAGYLVYAINPRAAARYRERNAVSGAKSDRGDAKMLADLVRTDRHNHRQVAGDSPQAQEIKILARGHQTLIWEKQRYRNRLRAALREYYPAALEAFEDCADRDALAVLAVASTPDEGSRVTVSRIKAALKRGGRCRYLDTRAHKIQEALRTDHLQTPDAVTAGFGATTRSTVAVLVAICGEIATYESLISERFEEHPDADIYRSLPGCGDVLGARALGEFGDDPERYAEAKSRRNYAATSPLTIASGKKRVVIARYIRNDHLHQALIQIAFLSRNTSPGCKKFYKEHRAQGDTHNQALRALANRLVSILHGCLTTNTLYNEETAWGHRYPTQIKKAA
ncbi:MAG: IS110 family transposase [Acidimicrobiia bacterium]